MVRLREAAVVALRDDEAARFIQMPSVAKPSLAASVLTIELKRLTEQKRLQYEQQVGSWSQADQEHLDDLTMVLAGSAPRELKPFLVRAVAKSEATGTLSGCSYRDELFLHHGSLGRSEPPTKPLPAVVFLPRAPTRVFATWSIDE